MAFSLVCNGNPLFALKSSFKSPTKTPSFLNLRTHNHFSSAIQQRRILKTPYYRNPEICIFDPVVNKVSKREESKEQRRNCDGIQEMLSLCGFGYWVQGFRCLPWLALNFHLTNNLKVNPSTLQLVQYSGNLPMVAKPFYGILSDALFIGGSRRLPYISIGVVLQVFSWGSMALIPIAGEALPILMVCVLIGNLGASITEVAKDALVAEYGQKNKINGLQSYAFMALAAGGVLGNCLGGIFLLKAHQTKSMFLTFASLLSLQFALSLITKEESLGLTRPSSQTDSISSSIKKRSSELMVAIREEGIFRPLSWAVASIAMVPVLSGSLFCYQTQCLNLDPSIIGMSKVIGQLLLLYLTVLYNRCWKTVSMRKLIGTTQILYAITLLLDLVLVKQINVKMGIPNDIFAVCFLGVAEMIAQFKILPFQVLFASLTPPGCEGSLMSFLASALCLSCIFSGFLGVGLASFLGITSSDYSSLPVGITIQFLSALVPLLWIHHIPNSRPLDEKEKKKGLSKRKRKTRRVGRVTFSIEDYVYRRERESEVQR